MDFFEKFDRQKLQRITLIVMSALFLLVVVLLIAAIILSTAENDIPDIPDNDIIDKDDIKDLKFEDLTITQNHITYGSLILANSEHKYVTPQDLKVQNIAEYRNSKGHTSSNFLYSVGDINQFCLQVDAMEQAHNMLVKLRDDTGDDSIKISAAYGKDDNTKDIHTGYSMVLTVAGKAEVYLSDESNTDLNSWLQDNAHKYGFVVRYPLDKSEITGVEDYDYAFRYVGIPHSYYMKENDLCQEEYIELLKTEHSSTKTALTVQAEGKVYLIYYQSCVIGASIDVPSALPLPDGSNAFEYSVSGTNVGGVVVTVEVK